MITADEARALNNGAEAKELEAIEHNIKIFAARGEHKLRQIIHFDANKKELEKNGFKVSGIISSDPDCDYKDEYDITW